MGTGYEPMSLAVLASHLASTDVDQTRWKLVWEFLEEFRWECGFSVKLIRSH
mgnify:CR=1 FL=1